MQKGDILTALMIISTVSIALFASGIDWATDGNVTPLTPSNNTIIFDLNSSYPFTGNASTQGTGISNISFYHNFNGTWVVNQTITNLSILGETTNQTYDGDWDSDAIGSLGNARIGTNGTEGSLDLSLEAVAVNISTQAGSFNYVESVNLTGLASVVLGTADFVGVATGAQAWATFNPPIQLEPNIFYTFETYNNSNSNTFTLRNNTPRADTIIQENEYITIYEDFGSGAFKSISGVQVASPNSSEINWTFNSSVPFGGNFFWNVEGCAADNTCGFSSLGNFTLSRNFHLGSETFQTEIIEGGSSDFELNFSSADKVLQNVLLTYNNTNFTGLVAQNGNNYSINLGIVSPTITATKNISFFWTLFYADGTTIETEQNNQTVNNLNIDDCGTHTVLIYNYTLLDEELKTKIANDTDIEISLDVYDFSEENIIVNFSKKYENINPAQICLQSNLSTEQYPVYSTVKYSANDTISNKTYVQEYHNILNGTLKNDTIPNNINLFDLDSTDSTDFQLIFRDSSSVLAPNILVHVYRQYVQDNDFKIVEAPLTDSNGETVLHLVRNDAIYNMIMIDQAGNIIATFNNLIAFCQDFTIGDCTINLNAPSEVTALYNYNTDLGVSYTEPTFSNLTNLISLSFVSNNLSAVDVKMEVTKSGNFGNRTVCEDSLIAVSGTLSCNVSTIVSTDRFLFVNLFVNNNLKATLPIDLQAGGGFFGVANGALFALIIFIIIVTSLMDDKKAILVGLGIGWVIILGLGLINGSLFGAFASGIWLLICILVMLWKMSRGGSS